MRNIYWCPGITIKLNGFIYLWSMCQRQQLLILIFKFYNDKVSKSLCWSRKTNDAVCILQLYYKDIWICNAYFINTMFSVWKRGFLERKDHWKGKESRGSLTEGTGAPVAHRPGFLSSTGWELWSYKNRGRGQPGYGYTEQGIKKCSCLYFKTKPLDAN